jgi:hypothetical protein
MLLPGAEHDQVAGIVAGRAEKDTWNPAAAVPVGDAGDDHDSAHAWRVEHPAFDRLLPCQHRRCLDRRFLGDSGIVPVDPVAADVEIGLAGAREGVGRRVDHGGVEVSRW